MRNISLSNKQIYHIYNRGVDKRSIFLNRHDYQRFADSLIVFNNKTNLNGRHFNDRENFLREYPLVNVIAYCIMPNHFHLLLEQQTDNGITKFLQKMTTSYTMYFNKKSKRTGALIQGVFKRSHIKSNERLLEMSRYIHTNPIKLFDQKKSSGISLKEKLLAYEWSSFPDYAGISPETPIVANKQIITNQFRSPKAYVKYILGET
jgi:putative transposase